MVLNTAYFDYYNLGLIVCAFLILFLAYRKGCIRQLMDVLTYFGSLVIAVLCSPVLAQWLPLFQKQDTDTLWDWLDPVVAPVVNIFIWFLIVFFSLRILYRILTLIFHRHKKTRLSLVNHMAGLALGGIKVLLLGMTLSLILRFPLIQYGDVFVEHSVLAWMDPIQEQLLEYWKG